MPTLAVILLILMPITLRTSAESRWPLLCRCYPLRLMADTTHLIIHHAHVVKEEAQDNLVAAELPHRSSHIYSKAPYDVAGSHLEAVMGVGKMRPG